MSDHEEKKKEQDKSRGSARNFGGVVYIGGVVAATVMFINFVLTAFPEDAYFSRVLMTIAGMAVGASMLAFPYALHNWIITKAHRFYGVPLYYGEMLIIGVNTVTSFVSLLAKYSGYDAPEWVVLYEPFSVASIIYTVFAWGTLFLTDPDHQLAAQERDAEAKFAQKVAAKRQEFLDSQEGEDLVIEIASQDIRERWNVDRFSGTKKSFGSGRSSEPVKTLPVQMTLPHPLESEEAERQPVPLVGFGKNGNGHK